MSDEAWMTVEQAAKALAMSEQSVRRLFDEGILKGYRTRPGGGWRRIYQSSVEAYRQAQRGESESPATD